VHVSVNHQGAPPLCENLVPDDIRRMTVSLGHGALPLAEILLGHTVPIDRRITEQDAKPARPGHETWRAFWTFSPCTQIGEDRKNSDKSSFS